MDCAQTCKQEPCLEHDAQTFEPKGLSRRGLLAGLAGIVATIGFGSFGESALAASKTYTACKTTDVRVGGAKIVTLPGTSTRVVITQPKKGVFKAFSPICTHEGAPLSGISGTSLVCNSHGARFNTTTGAATAGPTRKALKAYKVTISKTSVRVTI